MNHNPVISVVMPVYNAEEYLDEAIQSILDQTFIDFEFIIINDGSLDSSLEIIRQFERQDERILLLDKNNDGIVEALNFGLSIAKGKYIARMDSDDIAYPNRFEEKLKAFGDNPDVKRIG